jgi:dCMP deaminase
MTRPSKDQYYLNIAKEIAQRGTCFRSRFGAIIVKDDQIISTGYIGAPRGTKDCLERGYCLRDELKIPHGTQYEVCRSVHSEMNAIINAARAGVSLLGATMYMYSENPKTGELVDSLPCYICKKMMINAGLGKFIGNTKDGAVKIFHIEDWIAEWKQGDVLDDKHQYGRDRNIKDNLVSADEVRNPNQKQFQSMKEILMQEGKKENIINFGEGDCDCLIS